MKLCELLRLELLLRTLSSMVGMMDSGSGRTAGLACAQMAAAAKEAARLDRPLRRAVLLLLLLLLVLELEELVVVATAAPLLL